MFTPKHNTAIDMLITFVPNAGTSALSLDYGGTDNTRPFQTDLCNNNLQADYAHISKQIRGSEKKKRDKLLERIEFVRIFNAVNIDTSVIFVDDCESREFLSSIRNSCTARERKSLFKKFLLGSTRKKCCGYYETFRVGQTGEIDPRNVSMSHTQGRKDRESHFA